jgi:orotate phosphoribosyltransferase
VPGAFDPARSRLFELLRIRAFERKRVILASGRESDFFIDCKQAVLSAEGHALTGELMLDVSLTSYQRRAPLDAVYVRKDAKDHGSRRTLEGNSRLPAGSRIALLEDVVTTGGSTLKAAAKLREAGYVVPGVIALVDRLEGGRDAIEHDGLTLIALFTRADFIPT